MHGSDGYQSPVMFLVLFCFPLFGLLFPRIVLFCFVFLISLSLIPLSPHFSPLFLRHALESLRLFSPPFVLQFIPRSASHLPFECFDLFSSLTNGRFGRTLVIFFVRSAWCRYKAHTRRSTITNAALAIFIPSNATVGVHFSREILSCSVSCSEATQTSKCTRKRVTASPFAN